MHRRVRLAMLAVLALVAAAGWVQQRQIEAIEGLRRDDGEIVGLAARQGIWSQQVARQAALLNGVAPAHLQAANDALDASLAIAHAEALQLEESITAQARHAPEAATALAQAMARWQAARERLWYCAHAVQRRLDDGRGGDALRQAVAMLQAEVEPALTAARELAAQSQLAAQRRSGEAVALLRLLALGSGVLLLLLAFGVAEPTVRAVRRQNLLLAAQADQLARLAMVAERTQNAVMVMDAERRVVWVNDAFSRVTGHPAARVLGRSPARLLRAGRADPQTLARIAAALDEGRGLRVEMLNATREGREYWLDLDIQPLHDEAGVLTGFVVLASDVTDQVGQRLRMAQLLEALPAGVVLLDAEGRTIDSNPAAEQLLGLSAEQLRQPQQLRAKRFVRDDLSDWPAEERPLARALAGRQAIRGETVGVMRADGDLRWLQVNAEPLTDALGAPAGVVSCFTDVTEQRNQRALLELMVAASGLGTWQWDMRNGAMVCNERMSTMLGYRPGEVAVDRIKAWVELIHEDDRAPLKRALDEHLRHPGQPFRCDLRVRRPDGEWAAVLTCGTVIERDDGGQPRRMAGIHVDMTEQMQMQAMLRHAARTDGLTQLPNRVAVFDRVQQLISRHGQQPDSGYAVLFMDFDRFKQVNDTLGHAVGDELLQQIAQRLQRALRAGDLVGQGASYRHTAGRIGGDEFVVVLEPVRGRDEACAVARRLLDTLAAPYRIGKHVVHSTVSIGIVTSEQAANDAHTVMRDADTAMYEAKRSGRGRYAVFDPSMHERVAHSLGTENDLRQALARDELSVVYQPVVDLQRPGTAGVEALVRWQHPQRGEVMPSEFIPVAEDSGLIVELGRLVLERACHQFVAWQREHGARAPRTLAVNLSPAQLRAPRLVDDVRAILAASGIAPADLQLEVTESLAAQDELARARLVELKALGLRIALDDFGTGYSSLACLHQLPVDTVKIDRSFVSHAEHSEYHRALIEATIRVAETLGMSTVAEGIETPGQAALLRRLHCAKGQGYLFSRPLPADELADWLGQDFDAVLPAPQRVA